MFIETIPPVQKHFWYKRSNGDVFSCKEDEAFLTGRFHTFLGCSNGTEYRRILIEAQQKQRPILEEYKDLKALATNGEGNTDWNLLTKEDRERSQELMRELKKITLPAIREAEKAELAIAQQNMERPQDNRGRDLTGNHLTPDMQIGKKFADMEAGKSKQYRNVSEFQVSTKEVSDRL